MHRPRPLRRYVLPLLALVVCIPLLLLYLSGFLRGRSDAEALRLAEQAVRRAAVQCYALEGFYPPSIDYLAERYGVRLDDAAYFVDYQFIASNLMPDITVLPPAE